MEPSKTQKRVFIFIDTNLLWKDKNYFNFDIFNTFFIKQMINLRDFFIHEIKTTEIKIIIPHTSIHERYKQRYDLIKKDLDQSLVTLKSLKEIEQFDNDDVIKQLERIQKNLFSIITTKGDEFLSTKEIFSAPECPNEYFEKIIKKAYEKEKPFDSKKSDGFKDALIWYSIIEYLKTERVEKEDLIFLFTQNKQDFSSDNALLEFKNLIQNDLHIIDFTKPMQICNSESRDFLKYILKEAQNTKITQIKIGYSELDDSLTIEYIIADPFPNNLVSLIDTKNIRKIDLKSLLKEHVLGLLKNFNFDIDSGTILFEYNKVPNICDITVFLDFHEEGYYYDINSVEVMFEDGDEIESDYENIIIPADCIIHHRSPDFFEFFKIETEYNEYIAKMIGRQINRVINADLLTYTIID